MKALRHGDPASVGPFQLAARLGRGGMGVVYLGVDAAGRQAAVKVLRDEYADDPDFVRRFSREVAAAAAIDSPRVARLLDADPQAEQPWLAAEYVPGSDLLRVVARHGPLPADRLRRLAIELASALVAIHQAGVVRRDLKPGNVMLAPDGAKVIDFGIAAGLPGTVTATGVVLGSVGYMAPELLDTAGRPGPAADVFALGLTLAYAAAGRAPFGDGPLSSLLYRTVHAEPDLTALPRHLRTVVAATVRKQPDCRPSASRLLGELSTASPAGGLPTAPMAEPAEPPAERLAQAPPPRRASPAGSSAASSPLLSARFSIAGLDTVPDGLAASPPAEPATAHCAADAGGRRRRRALVPVAGMLVALAAAASLLAASDPETAVQPPAAAHGTAPKAMYSSPPTSRPSAGTTAPPDAAAPDGESTVGQDAGSSGGAASAHTTGSAATSAQGAPAVTGQPVAAAPASGCAASGTDGAAADDACESGEDGGGSQTAARNRGHGPPPWAGQPGGPEALLSR
ncbi:protein kinase [Frankia sp. Mgl5]|uniref:serine/threonine-protein kinase n=1 Tax=Frankia sp. Mgl5 TaxID=2933793 RepID=UPI00200DBE90|nr:serine/threonine-protein kinase [Frankia sp. Mgl5]MCK9928959.1 protein kinase [Frankia sp. Mgl5]